MEKKTRTVWTLYEKWSVVEALLGSGMTVTEYCRDRARIGDILLWKRLTAFILRILYLILRIIVSWFPKHLAAFILEIAYITAQAVRLARC